MLFVPLKQWDCGCVSLKTLRCVRVKVKTMNYLLSVDPALNVGCSQDLAAARAQERAGELPHQRPRHIPERPARAQNAPPRHISSGRQR